MQKMKYIMIALLLVPAFAFLPSDKSFEEIQKSFPRVSEAYERKEELIKMRCRSKDVAEEFGNMFIRVFKQEAQMEVWVRNSFGNYILFNSYKVYAMSGTLGPKRQQGDAQVPEGFYHINEFNPYSNYLLSLGINYPNESDMKLSAAPKKGGSIFIHGGQVSAGCMAMSDYYIEDIYLCAVKARNQGQEKIPVHVFPFRMTTQNTYNALTKPENKAHAKLWANLQQGYLFFEQNKRVPDVYVSAEGYYKFVDVNAAQASSGK
ncbi:MAG: L,D-transpeptidase family protein [Chitinophagales bacterium]|nr:L,D-transpeptidase family protein [Chitinophagales bacterium]